MAALARQAHRVLQMSQRSLSIGVLAGPPGVGKEALAVRLASELDIELISASPHDWIQGVRAADSALVDCGLPVHMVGTIEPSAASPSSVSFTKEIFALAHDITARGRMPLVVGGAPFYLLSLAASRTSGVRIPDAVLSRVSIEMDRMSPGEAHARLHELDPVYAKSVEASDSYRIMRGIAAAEAGTPISQHQKRGDSATEQIELRGAVLSAPRDLLFPRINDECERIVSNGLVHEAIGLYDNVDELSFLSQTAGYSHALKYIKDSWLRVRVYSRQSRRRHFRRFLSKYQTTTRHFAKNLIRTLIVEPSFVELQRTQWSPEEDDLLFSVLSELYTSGKRVPFTPLPRPAEEEIAPGLESAEDFLEPGEIPIRSPVEDDEMLDAMLHDLALAVEAHFPEVDVQRELYERDEPQFPSEDELAELMPSAPMQTKFGSKQLPSVPWARQRGKRRKAAQQRWNEALARARLERKDRQNE
eukprot:m.51242 g.51242  ORF g.51242 m.51242 type:complete len:474 (+) comp6596_c0_seq3:24-1445(+)